jgi:hypothetical protein
VNGPVPLDGDRRPAGPVSTDTPLEAGPGGKRSQQAVEYDRNPLRDRHRKFRGTAAKANQALQARLIRRTGGSRSPWSAGRCRCPGVQQMVKNNAKAGIADVNAAFTFA